MSADGGWIKLWRKMLENPALHDDARCGLWVRLLLLAAHKPTRVDWRGQTIGLQRGEVAISARSFAAKGGLTHKAIRVALDRFLREGMIAQRPIWGTAKGTAKGTVGTLVTICNFDQYQTIADTRGTAEGTAEGTTGAQQGHTEQEGKNDKKEESNIVQLDGGGHRRHRFGEFWACWTIPGTKVDKSAAERKYRSLLAEGVEHDELCGGVARYMAHCKRERKEIRYIKSPSTWLNKGCWQDELTAKTEPSGDDGDQWGLYS